MRCGFALPYVVQDKYAPHKNYSLPAQSTYSGPPGGAPQFENFWCIPCQYVEILLEQRGPTWQRSDKESELNKRGGHWAEKIHCIDLTDFAVVLADTDQQLKIQAQHETKARNWSSVAFFRSWIIPCVTQTCVASTGEVLIRETVYDDCVSDFLQSLRVSAIILHTLHVLMFIYCS